MVEGAQSYEMVRNFKIFKAFVMFAVKKLEALLILSKNFEYAYVSPENFFLTMLMLVRKIFLISSRRQHFGKNLYDLENIPGNVGQNMTTPPPPNVDGFATSLEICQLKKLHVICYGGKA